MDESKPEKRGRRTFSDEFKREAVNLVIVEGYSMKRAAEAVGVSPKSIREWLDKHGPALDTVGDDETYTALLEENKLLFGKCKQRLPAFKRKQGYI